MSELSPEQSFTIHLKSLTDFADEFTTQIQSLQAPMDHLATMAGTPPQYGAFHEAWVLGAGEQAAIEEMFNLLGQVKQAIAFAGDVTGTVADGYRKADESIAYALGGPPPTNNGNNPNGPWSWNGNGHGDGNGNGNGNGQYGGSNQPYQYSDPTQNNPVTQVTATPVGNATDPGPWVPNQNTNGPFPGTPMTAVPLAGALLGGALLGTASRSKSHHRPADSANTTSFDAGLDGGSSAPGGALPLWTPPPEPGQDASWTATTPDFPDSPQGGS